MRSVFQITTVAFSTFLDLIPGIAVLMLIVPLAATRAADAEVPTTADFAACNEQAPEAVKAGTATPIMGDHVRADNARADAMTTTP